MMPNDKAKYPQLEKIKNVFTTPPNYPVKAIAFSPDGLFLAVALANKTHSIKILNTTSGKEISNIRGHTAHVNTITFSSDGKWLASGSDDMTIKIWNVASAEIIFSLHGHTGAVLSIAFTPDSLQLASISDDSIKIWDMAYGNLLNSLPEDPSLSTSYNNTSITFSPDGKLFATACDDRNIRIWEFFSSTCIHCIEESGDWISSIAFNPRDSSLASASGKTIRIWDANSAELLQILEQKNPRDISSIAFSCDGTFLASASGNIIEIWDIASAEMCKALSEHTGWISSIAFSYNGKLLASGAFKNGNDKLQGTLKLWSTPNFTPIFRTLQPPHFSVLQPENGSSLHHARLEIMVEINNDNSLEYTVQINRENCAFAASEQDGTEHTHATLTITLPENLQGKAFVLTVKAKNSAGETSQQLSLFYNKEATQQENPSPKAQPSPKKVLIPQRQLALVMGNQSYTQAPLANPLNDAQGVKKVLENKLRFEVHHHENCSADAMKTAMQQFEESLKKTAGADVALFFFAGHGLEVGGSNYLIPTEREFHSESDIRYHAVKLSDVLEAMNRGGAMLNIIILDACRSNPFRGLSSDERTPVPSGGFASVVADRHFALSCKTYEGAKGVIIAFSTSPLRTASDGYGKKNSPYTAALLKHIQTPNLHIEEVFRLVRQDVSIKTQDGQQPWNNTNMRGDFYFNPQQ